jgi:uncharacterized protein (DUF1778 family)
MNELRVITLRITPAEHRAITEAAYQSRRSINQFVRAVVGEATRAFWRCRVCGCTEADCRQCIEKTGQPCAWVEPCLCSACVDGVKS